ncbi:hypothetical protein SDC9_155943 [bioreactor metagenome]|uniref:Uncharacterized protein n=1 Tax=bioreactor metagenome TaxID=1076179 RepID=A0A645F2V8_9ZZZZ
MGCIGDKIGPDFLQSPDFTYVIEEHDQVHFTRFLACDRDDIGIDDSVSWVVKIDFIILRLSVIVSSLNHMAESITAYCLNIGLADQRFFTLAQYFLHGGIDHCDFLVLIQKHHANDQMIDQARKPFIILLDFIHLIIQTFGKFIDGFARFLEITEAFAFISRIILVIRKFFGDIHHRIDRSADAFRQSIGKYEGYCQSQQDKNVKGLFDALTDRQGAQWSRQSDNSSDSA